MGTSATLRNPPWLDGITFASQDARLTLVAALLASAGSTGTTGIAARPGVRPGVGAPLFVQAASGMNITVNNGLAFVQGTAALDAGIYPVCLDTTTTLTVSTADPTNPRIDNVCLTILDNGDATSTFVVQIQAGTPASSPVAPTLPGNSLLLATIQVNASATSITTGNITDQRQFTVTQGGILYCGSSASYPASGPEQQYLHDGTTHRLRRLNGSGGTSVPLVAPFATVSAQVTTPVTCTSNTVKQVVTQVTVTVDGSTPVEVTGSWSHVGANTASVGDSLGVLLFRDATQIKQRLVVWDQSVHSTMEGGTVATLETPPAGTHTYYLYLLNQAAGKSFTMQAGSGFPIDLYVKPAPQ